MEQTKFYGTFMFKQATRKMYVEIIAPNEQRARDAMFAHFGDKFMTVYSEERFKGQVEEFGLSKLLTIMVDEHPNFEYYLPQK